MFASELAVSLGDENPAVAMSLPRGNGFEINANLNRASDEAPAERTWGEMGKSESFAGGSQRLFWVSDLEHLLSLLNLPLRFHVSQKG